MIKSNRYRHFQNVLINPFWNLTDIAPQLGVSKQRVSQLFKECFNTNYSTHKQIKREAMERELACWDTPRHPAHFLSILPESSHWHRHFKAEIKFIEKLKQDNLLWSYERRLLRTRFRINGRLVAVRTCEQAKLVCSNGPEYYKYVMSCSPVDFLACYRPDIDSFYIVPGGDKHIYIRPTISIKPWAGDNYLKYFDAFHLLGKK